MSERTMRKTTALLISAAKAVAILGASGPLAEGLRAVRSRTAATKS
ncbi:hypothetical protein [Bradyrhizobium sp. BR 10261]|nr:hypothetical protein [Bradyrhizobium sp. BR 10261]MBW7966339.1 hypothetical protein [Bradyrhizobium sp. BR 10261]